MVAYVPFKRVGVSITIVFGFVIIISPTAHSLLIYSQQYIINPQPPKHPPPTDTIMYPLFQFQKEILTQRQSQLETFKCRWNKNSNVGLLLPSLVCLFVWETQNSLSKWQCMYVCTSYASIRFLLVIIGHFWELCDPSIIYWKQVMTLLSR